MEHLVFVRLMDEPGLRDKLFKGIAKSVAPVSPKEKEKMKEFEKWQQTSWCIRGDKLGESQTGIYIRLKCIATVRGKIC